MNNNTSDHNKEQKHKIRLKIPGVSFMIETSAGQIIKLTIIVCVFIIAMTLIVRTSFIIPEQKIKKIPADNLSAGTIIPSSFS